MYEEPNYEAEIQKALAVFYIFSAIATLSPALSFIEALKPDGQLLNLWFQRSGAPMVVFSLLAQMKATEVFNILNPTVMVGTSFTAVEQKYKKYPTRCNVVSLILTTVGTIIWGYGDLMIGA